MGLTRPTPIEHTWPGTKDAVPDARAWLVHMMGTLGADPEVTGDAALVLSEVATNAVRHTRSGEPGGKFKVKLTRGATGVRIEVTDQGAARDPVLVRGGADAEHGFGLPLVEYFAAQWWVRGDEGGRTIGADIGGPRRGGRAAP